MKNKLITFLPLFMAVSFFSCEKFSDDEVFNDKDANSMLVIRTRPVLRRLRAQRGRRRLAIL